MLAAFTSVRSHVMRLREWFIARSPETGTQELHHLASKWREFQSDWKIHIGIVFLPRAALTIDFVQRDKTKEKAKEAKEAKKALFYLILRGL